MIQTILIVLVAVVVLIVIIAVLALRYLRADDSDTFDDIPDEPRPGRRPADKDRGRASAPAERRPRQPEPVAEVWADRPTRMADTRAPAGFRDSRDSGARPASPQRAASPAPARREAVGSRPVRAATRPDGPDSATSSWDSLSDVDYWAELAADKPEITPAAGRSAARADSGPLPMRTRQAQPSRQAQSSQPARLVSTPSARSADGGQTEQIDLRVAQAGTARYNSEPAAVIPDSPGRHGQPRPVNGQRPVTSQRPDLQATQQHQRPSGNLHRASGPRPAQPAQPAYQSRPPAPAGPPYPNDHGHADNDPLTSPSFPAINTADSRSYRTQRSGSSSQPGTSDQHARPATGPGATSHQFIEYSSAPRRTTSQPDPYPASPAGAPSQPAAQAAGQPAAANPYGSYVSQPPPAYSEGARPQNGYQSSGYPEPPAPSLAAAAYSGYGSGQQAASADWYAAPAVASGSPHAAAQPADGYLPAAGLGGTGGGGGHALNGSSSRGYAGIDYSNLRYDDPVYPDTQGALPGYGSAGQHTAQYDQQGYGTPEPGSGQDGYGAYPGYGASGR